MRKVVIQLDPVTCPSCIKKIEGAVTKMDGVETAKVLFNSSKVKVDFNDAQISGDEISEVIQKLGYGVQTVKVS